MTKSLLAPLLATATVLAIAKQTQAAPLHAAWSKSIRLSGLPLVIRIWTKRTYATEIEVVAGRVIESVGRDDLYFDGSVQPYLRVERDTALLAFAANPGAGSGQYASVWKIWSRGQRIEQLGAYRDADLRQWFTTGVIQEIRPTKYATEDVLRAYPNLFDSESLRDKDFIISYGYNRKAKRFKFLRFRMVPLGADRNESVRFPDQ